VLGDQALTVHRAELAPEPADMDVDGAAVDTDVPAVRRGLGPPDAADQVGAAEHGARVRAEEGQQFELLKGQRELRAAGPGPALNVVDQQPGSWLRDQVRLANRGSGLWLAGHADRVTDDGQRGPRARDRHHGEQGCVPARRRNVLIGLVAGLLGGGETGRLRSGCQVTMGHSPIVK
jgi:hypothetical protein